MSGQELFFLIFAVLGGLALFIFGMNVMTDGLREAAGTRLREILGRTTRHRLAGLGLGTALGFLVQSSATTVMLVGFVNAGLMTLAETVPPMLGCNIGTSLSMQIISFKLDEYCLFAITIGFLVTMLLPQLRAKAIGRAILGFGLLFLGMKTMSGAIGPHRDVLAPVLARINGSTLPGMLAGVLLSTAITGIIQSSGATIGMCYALIQAGAFTQLAQVYPIVLGAHIGTCATALLGSIGTNVDARRSAVSHLLFNVFNAALGVAAARFFFWLVPLTANDLTHQTANLHTLVMVAGVILVLPFHRPYARLIAAIVPSRTPPPPPSYLDRRLLDRPEEAIYAAIKELRRVAEISSQSMRLTAELFFTSDRQTVQTIKLNEKVVDDIKDAMGDYLMTLTRRYLSRRQSILIEDITRCMADIERIADHIEEFADLSLSRNRRVPAALVDTESFEALFDLYKSAHNVVNLVIRSLDPDKATFVQDADVILKARDEYMAKSRAARELYGRKIAERAMTPVASMYFGEYMSALNRIVRHSKTIAIAELQPEFWIKKEKLGRVAKEPPAFQVPELVDPKLFLSRLDEIKPGAGDNQQGKRP